MSCSDRLRLAFFGFFILLVIKDVLSVDKSYYYVKEQKSWYEAELYCRRTFNGSLVTNTSRVAHLLPSLNIPNNVFWTGNYERYTSWIIYQGCYGNFHNESKRYQKEHGNPSTCQIFCSQYKFFAIQKNICICLENLTGLREVVEQKCQRNCQDGIRKCEGHHFISVYHKATFAVEVDYNHKECLTVTCRTNRSKRKLHHQAHNCSDSLNALCKLPYESNDFLLNSEHTWQDALRICERSRNSTLAPAVNEHKLCSRDTLRNAKLWINGFKGYVNTSTLIEGSNLSRDSVRNCMETRFTSTYNAFDTFTHRCFGVNRTFICESEIQETEGDEQYIHLTNATSMDIDTTEQSSPIREVFPWMKKITSEETTQTSLFTYHNEAVPWHLATEQCVSKGGHLAKFTPANKQSFPRLYNKTIWNRNLAIFTSWLGVFGCYRITSYQQSISLSEESQNSYTAQCNVKCRGYDYLAVQLAVCVCLNDKPTRNRNLTACSNICRAVDIPHTCGGQENFYNVFQRLNQTFHITKVVLTKQCLSEQCKSRVFSDVQFAASDCDTTKLKYFCEKNMEGRDIQTWTNSLSQCFENNSHLQFLFQGPCVKGTMKVGRPYWIGLFREPYYFAASDSHYIPKEDYICTSTRVDSNRIEQYSVNCSSKLPFVCEYNYIPTPASTRLHPDTPYGFHHPSKELWTQRFQSSLLIDLSYNETIDNVNSYASNNSSDTNGSNFKNPYYSTEHQYNYEITDLFPSQSLLEYPEISSSNNSGEGIKPSYWISDIEFRTIKTDSSIRFSTFLSDSLYQTTIMQVKILSQGPNHTGFYNATQHETLVGRNSEIDEKPLKIMYSDTHMNDSTGTPTLHQSIGSMSTLYSSFTYINAPENTQSHLDTVDLIITPMPSQTTFASGTVSFINNASLSLVIRTDKLSDTWNLDNILTKSSMTYNLDDLLITSRYASVLEQYSNFVSDNNELIMTSDPVFLSSENPGDTLSEFPSLGDKISSYPNLSELFVTSTIRNEHQCMSSITVAYKSGIGISSSSSSWQSSSDEVVVKETEDNHFPFQSTIVYTTRISQYPVEETLLYSGNSWLIVPENESALTDSYFSTTEMMLTTLDSSFMEIESSPVYSTRTMFFDEIISRDNLNNNSVRNIKPGSMIVNATSIVNETPVATQRFTNVISTNINVTKFSLDNNIDAIMNSSVSKQVISASSSSNFEGYSDSIFEIEGTNTFSDTGSSESILFKTLMPDFIDSLVITSSPKSPFDQFSDMLTNSDDSITSNLILFSSENPSDTLSEFQSSGDKMPYYSNLLKTFITSLTIGEYQYSSSNTEDNNHGMPSASSFLQSPSDLDSSKEPADTFFDFHSIVVYTTSSFVNPGEETSSYSGHTSWRVIPGNASDLIPKPSSLKDSYLQTTEMIPELTLLESSFTEAESHATYSTRTLFIEGVISSDNFLSSVINNIRSLTMAVNTTSEVNEGYNTNSSFADDISTNVLETKFLHGNMNDIMVSFGSEQILTSSSCSSNIDAYSQSSLGITETTKLRNVANSENAPIKSSMPDFSDLLGTKSEYERTLGQFSNLLSISNDLIMTSNIVLFSSEHPSDSSYEFSVLGDKMSQRSNLLETSVISMNRSELQYLSAIAVDNTREMLLSSSFWKSSSDEIVSEESKETFPSFESAVVYTTSMAIYPIEETSSYSGNASAGDIPGNESGLTSEVSSLSDSYLQKMTTEMAPPESSFVEVTSPPLNSSRSQIIGELISSVNFDSPFINNILSMPMSVHATSSEKEKYLTISGFANDISSRNLLIKFSQNNNNNEHVLSSSEQVIGAIRSRIDATTHLSNTEIRDTDLIPFQRTAIIESSNFLHSKTLSIVNEQKQHLTLYKQSHLHLESEIDSYSNIEASMPTYDDFGLYNTSMENINDKSIKYPDNRSSIDVEPSYSDSQFHHMSSVWVKTSKVVPDNIKPTETKQTSVSTEIVPSSSPMTPTSSSVYHKHLVHSEPYLLSDKISRSEINTKIFIKGTDSPIIASTRHSPFIINTQIHLRSETIYEYETTTKIMINPTQTTKTFPADTDKMSRSWNRNKQLIVVATAGVVIALITCCCIVIRIRYFREAQRKEKQKNRRIHRKGETANTVPWMTFANRIYYEESV